MIGTDGKCGICGMVMSLEGLTFHSCGGVPTLVAPQPPPDGPGSHAWDFREMQIQRERADKAEARADTTEANLAEATQRIERLERQLTGQEKACDEAEAKAAEAERNANARVAMADGIASSADEARLQAEAKLADVMAQRDEWKAAAGRTFEAMKRKLAEAETRFPLKDIIRERNRALAAESDAKALRRALANARHRHAVGCDAELPQKSCTCGADAALAAGNETERP